MNKSIGFASTDWCRWPDGSFARPLLGNGCQWYRGTLPMEFIREFGWETDQGLLGFDANRGFGIQTSQFAPALAHYGYSVVVLKLIMQKQILHDIPAAQALGQKVVIDMDDFFVELPKSNLAYETTDPLTHPDSNREIYEKSLYLADALIVSTQFLYDYYSSRRSNVFLVRNSIDLSKFSRRKDSGSWQPKIGWAGMTPWRGGDLETIPWLKGFLTEHKLKFHHSGHSPEMPRIHEMIGLDDNQVTVSEQYPVTGISNLYQQFDVGIVPLATHDFNKCKSYLKGLEMAACGVPFVAQALPEYEFFANAGVGRVAYDAEDWMAHLEDLMSPKVRKEESDRQYEIVKNNFTFEQTKHEWAAVYEKILML